MATLTEPLVDFVVTHTQRGECNCGRCIDRADAPDPVGHTVDTGFFKVALVGEPSRDEFVRLVQEHRGEYAQFDMLDFGMHSYVDVGAWIGDQGLGMQCMALGHLLKVWQIVSSPGHGCIKLPLEMKA